MALITPVKPTVVGQAAAFVATAVSGDEVQYSGGDLVIEFENAHVSSITINIAPTKTTAKVPGAGPVTVPTRALALAAAGRGVFVFTSNDIRNYLNANKRIPITYTGGNVAMVMRALRLN